MVHGVAPFSSPVSSDDLGRKCRLTHGRTMKRQIAAGVLAGAIFCLDNLSALGGGIATLYVLVLLLASDRLRRPVLISWSFGCAFLTVVSFLLVHGLHAEVNNFVRMVVSLAAISVTTGLLLYSETMNGRVEREERRSRRILNALATAIWEHDFQLVASRLKALRAQGVLDLRSYIAEHPAFVNEMRHLVRITDVNNTALALMGVRSKDEFFRRLAELLPDTDTTFADCLVAIDEQRDMFQAEATVISADGSPIDIIVAFSLAPGTDLSRVPGSILDIRQRKRLESTVARTRSELERAQRSASVAAMSASIAHEINQPLSAIQNYASAASRWLDRAEPRIEETRQALASLEHAVAYTYDVMQRIRNLVGGAKAEMEPVDLKELIAATVALVKSDVEASGARITFAAAGAPPMLVLADEILIKQLLINLISNASQAMERAGSTDRLIAVSVTCEETAAVIHVRDHGPGLDETDTANVFDAFFTTRPDGMGLGLAICRSIVDMHGGDISAVNRREGGAEVRIGLPLNL